jgi:sec-independent protein translocase protein TatC
MPEVISSKKKANNNPPKKEWTILGILEKIRGSLFRIIVALVVFSTIAFIAKDIVFNSILLAPSKVDFITYKVLCRIGESIGQSELCMTNLNLSIVNLNLSGQFMKHFWVSIYVGMVLVFPLILFEIWRIAKPFVNAKFRKNLYSAIPICSLLFFIGILFSYFIIVPITIHFLATYSISSVIVNTITLDSYLGSVITLTLAVGLVFEMPILLYNLSKFGLISKEFLKKQRKYAVVILLIVAAFITPGSDLFSLALVSVPLLALYEVSIFVIPKRIVE